MRVLEFFFGGGKWYNEGLQREEEHGVEQWWTVTNGTREEEKLWCKYLSFYSTNQMADKVVHHKPPNKMVHSSHCPKAFNFPLIAGSHSKKSIKNYKVGNRRAYLELTGPTFLIVLRKQKTNQK